MVRVSVWVAAPVAKVAVVGRVTVMKSSPPVAVMFTVRGSDKTPCRVRVNSTSSPSVWSLPTAAMVTNGRSLSFTVTLAVALLTW